MRVWGRCKKVVNFPSLIAGAIGWGENIEKYVQFVRQSMFFCG